MAPAGGSLPGSRHAARRKRRRRRAAPPTQELRPKTQSAPPCCAGSRGARGCARAQGMLKMASYNNYDSYYTENPEPGDLIEVFRPGYQHWTLYLGDGYVINMAPTDEGRNGGIQKSHDSPQLAQEVNEDSSPVPFTSAKSVFSKKALVRMQLLKDVVGSDTYRINNKYDDMYSPLPLDEIIRLSEFLIGQEVSYDLLVNNCEHFVTLLRYGEGISEQANRAIGAIGIVTAAAGAFSLLGLFPSKQRQKHY